MTKKTESGRILTQVGGVTMKEIRKKANIVLMASTVIILFIIFFIDNDSLNSLLINYNEDFTVNEVAVLDVDYNKVIYQDTNVTQVSSQPDTTAPVTPVSNTATGSWAWPTDSGYTITTYYSASHKALDIYKGYASNIYAANNGTVSMVKSGCIPGNTACNGRGGNYVVINHNASNYYTVYMHLKDIYVKPGDTVSKGQVIASMGNTGNVIPVPTSSAPYLGTHLHFCLYIGEPYRGGYAVNPMRLY